MRYLLALLAFSLAAPASASEPVLTGEPAPTGEPPSFRLIRAEDGGFFIERARPDNAPNNALVDQTAAHTVGLADAAEISALLVAEFNNRETIDYSNGVKFDGVYSIVVGREDGTLTKYERASDVIAFVTPKSIAKAGAVTTLDGAIVFALKVDNKNAVQRFERGVITLTEVKKSL